MNLTVAIIILNWNGWKDTIECLESLYQITYPYYYVIVVDNGSENESVEKINEYAEGKIVVKSKFFEYDAGNKPIKIIEYTREEAEAGGGDEKEIADLPSNKKIILIKNEKNYGFAEGNNIAMRYALKVLSPDYVLLLNNDTVVDRNILEELVKVAEPDPKIGIVGSKNYYYDQPNVIQLAGGIVDYNLAKARCIGAGSVDDGQYNKIREVDFVDGSALLMKKEVVDKVGMLDPDYFAYWDDPDLCVRANRGSYKTVYVPKARMWHKVSGTAGSMSPFFVYYTTSVVST
ncbi:MAG: glycosyltransferase family 2 protein, partial [Methanophagales archaeon]|nr:glycosyltransferase family 2 protein [Methanophagales archaeon]